LEVAKKYGGFVPKDMSGMQQLMIERLEVVVLTVIEIKDNYSNTIII